jgi:hypothetical protein
MAFVDLLKELNGIDDGDLATFQGLATKYPDLDKKLVSASDLRDVSKERAKLQSKLDEKQAEVDTWNSWRDKNWIPDAEMTVGEKQAREELNVLQSRLADTNSGRTPSGDNRVAIEPGDFESLKTQLTAAGYVTKAELDGITSKLPVVESALGRHDQVMAGFERMYRETAHLPFQYHNDIGAKLGKPFSMGAFIDYATATPERTKDLGKAYEEFIAPDKAALDLKVKGDELAAGQAKLEADRAALESKRTSAPGPDDTGGGAPQSMGFFERRLRHPSEANGKSATDGQKLGTGTTAAIAAELYRKGELVPAGDK